MKKKTFLQGVASGAGVVILLIAVYVAGASGNGGLSFGSGTKNPTVNNPTAPAPTAPAGPTADASKMKKVGNDDHIRGNKNAKITLVEYSDFECPFCSQFAPTMEQVLAEYPNDVRLVYRHFPLSFHPQAQKAAEASECAAEQGKFWEMHDKLFDLNIAKNMSVDSFKTAAADLGLNTGNFNTCLDSGKMASKVQEDYSDGLAAGINGTPGTFINEEFVAGALPFAQIKSIIDGQL